jgi:hypothetical protein
LAQPLCKRIKAQHHPASQETQGVGGAALSLSKGASTKENQLLVKCKMIANHYRSTNHEVFDSQEALADYKTYANARDSEDD